VSDGGSLGAWEGWAGWIGWEEGKGDRNGTHLPLLTLASWHRYAYRATDCASPPTLGKNRQDLRTAVAWPSRFVQYHGCSHIYDYIGLYGCTTFDYFKSVSDTIRGRRLSLFGHVVPISVKTHSRALQSCILGPPRHWRRRVGRPRQSWLRRVEDDLTTSQWRQQGGAHWIDRHGGYSWRRLRLLGMLERERSRIGGELVFGSQNNTPDDSNGVNNAVSCYKEAVQFSASLVTSLFASFWRNLWNGS